MTRTDDLINVLTGRLDDQRKHAHRLKERAELDGTRITASEDTITAHARKLTDLCAIAHSLQLQHDAARKLCDGRRDANANTLGRIQTEIEAVLEAHTASIFRLTQRIDNAFQEILRLWNVTPQQSPAEHVTNANDLNVEGFVDPPQPVVDAATTDTPPRPSPRSTVPPEQRLIG